MFEKTRATCAYLDEVHLKYLALIAVISGLNKSEVLREILDREMTENAELCKQYSELLFIDNSKPF